MRRTLASFALSLPLLVSPLTGFAQGINISTTDKSAQLELGNDLYIAGENVGILNAHAGDVVAAGGRVIIAGPVEGDVNTAGGSINMDSAVGDDVRIAGGNITVHGSAGGDMIVFGGSIYIANDAKIVGNLLIFGGDISMDGLVSGNLMIRGGNAVIRGTVGGDVDIASEQIQLDRASLEQSAKLRAQKIAIQEGTTISGNLHYWQKDDTEDFSAFVSGTTQYDDALAWKKPHDGAKPAEAAVGILAAVTIYGLLFAALCIGLLLWATKSFFVDSAKYLRKQPWMSFLWGFLYFIVTPVLAIILLMTVIGIPLGIITLVLYGLSVFFAKIFASLVLARAWELKAKKKTWKPVTMFFAALGIYILLELLMLIPILGWIVVCLLVCASYGGILQAKKDRWKKIR